MYIMLSACSVPPFLISNKKLFQDQGSCQKTQEIFPYGPIHFQIEAVSFSVFLLMHVHVYTIFHVKFMSFSCSVVGQYISLHLHVPYVCNCVSLYIHCIYIQVCPVLLFGTHIIMCGQLIDVRVYTCMLDINSQRI